MKSISVHIVTYNSADCIDECLDTVMGQTYSASQVIVIDNDSRDDTWERLSRWADRVDIVKNSVNNGFAGGHNQAIRMTSSDYCLVLNPDVTLAPDYIRSLIERMEADEKIGSATGMLLSKAAPLIVDSTGLVINKARRAFDRGVTCLSEGFREPAVVFGVSGAAAMYKRAMIEDISVHGEFFDEDFFAYKEDVDVAWRAQLMGWQATFVPNAVGYHERGWKAGGRAEKPLFIRRLSYINRYKMMFKNDQLFFVLKHLSPLLIYEILSLGYALVREPKLLGTWSDFGRKLPKLWEKRKHIQGKRTSSYEQVYSWFK